MSDEAVVNVKLDRPPEIEAAATKAWKDALEVAARVAERRLEAGRADSIPAALRELAI